MAYLAIARKYRPATFDEIVGQDHVVRTLTNAIASNRIHHAYLFAGARGVGKTTAARALARALNCASGPTAKPCGTCPSCLEIGNGNSPDLIEIDGASNNSVEDVRDLRETVRYAPTRGQKKIYLVDEVHMLSKAAWNALLKTLEEPPPHVVFIFATTEASKIPDTILSRCQRFDFKRIPVAQIAERLQSIATAEGVNLTESALKRIARAGDGSMRDAQSLLDQVISFGAEDKKLIGDVEVAQALGLIDPQLMYDMLGGLFSGTPDRCLEVIAAVYEHGHEMTEFSAELLEMLRNATFVRLSPSARKHLDLAPDELERLVTLTQGVDPEVIGRTFTAVLETHDQVSRAPRPRTVLEMAVARLATTRPVQPVGVLMGRLEDLERRLRTQGAGATAAPLRPQSGQRSPRSPKPPAAGEKTDDDSPAASPSTAANTTSAEAPDARWRQFKDLLVGEGFPYAHIPDGTWALRGNVLVVALGGRGLAEARRVMGDATVALAMRRCYPEGTALQIVSASEPRGEDLTRTVAEEPAIRRIIERLGARIKSVKRQE